MMGVGGGDRRREREEALLEEEEEEEDGGWTEMLRRKAGRQRRLQVFQKCRCCSVLSPGLSSFLLFLRVFVV